MQTRRVAFVFGVALTLLLLIAGCVPIQPPTPVPGAEATAAPAEEPTVAPAEEAAPVEIDPEKTVVAIPVETAPTLDGIADDAVWADAPALAVELADGANSGETTVNLKAVYTQDTLYMLITWADPTESFIRSPWEKQADGTWAKLSDPNDKGGDNNLYYEDKLALIWTINDSIPRFRGMGCYAACHDGENPDVKPFGNKYTEEGTGDIWHWKSVRNLGQMDDQYLDSTPYSADTPEAGRHSDPKDSGGYVDNQTEDKTMPMWMGPEGSAKDGSPGYILDSEKVAFDDSLFAPGDRVPGIVKSAITGDRGDISAGWKWADGVWTLEISRALVTGSEYDVQFDDLTKPYYFGVAAFDNAQVRHAYHDSSRTLVFQP